MTFKKKDSSKDGQESLDFTRSRSGGCASHHAAHGSQSRRLSPVLASSHLTSHQFLHPSTSLKPFCMPFSDSEHSQPCIVRILLTSQILGCCLLRLCLAVCGKQSGWSSPVIWSSGDACRCLDILCEQLLVITIPMPLFADEKFW